MAYKTMNEVLGKLKGAGNEKKIIPGKGAPSTKVSADLLKAMVNNGYTLVTVDKKGVKEEVNLREAYAADVKKTIANAGYPQKSEINVVDTAELETSSLGVIANAFIRETVMAGKKFVVKGNNDFSAELSIRQVPGRVKESVIRDPKNPDVQIGTVTTTTKDWFQLRSKSNPPASCVSKVRKDMSGKVVTG